ncbi:MAG TPA: hypothetical protein VKF59_14210 [Candidatus Dormibacteraeota bacterium]|nr:hypothetical protein [Candidatus Dormibacteraeota bacterium]
MRALSPVLALGAAAALALLVVSARRPALACGLLALAIPLTAGMARGAAVPVLRVNEAPLLIVATGSLVHWLTRRPPSSSPAWTSWSSGSASSA